MATAAVPGVSAGAPASPSRQAFFRGKGGTLFVILLLNLLLSVLTLGIYYFWGKVRARQFLLGQTEFEGDRFAYHATGKELLIGWLKVVVFFGLLAAVRNGVPLLWKHWLAEPAVGVLGGLVFLAVYPLAVIGSRRFRLSRTSWRGIRFSFRGRARRFWWTYMSGGLLTVLTLGLYYPYFQNRVRKFLIEHSHFGTTRFSYDGRGRALFWPFCAAAVVTFGAAIVVGWSLADFVRHLGLAYALEGATVPLRLLWPSLWRPAAALVVTLAAAVAVWLWSTAWRHRYVWSHTAVATAAFRSTVTGWRLLWLIAGDALRLMPTLGLAWPWVVVRHIRFTLANLHLVGTLDLDAIQQDAQAASAVGESLADFMGILDFDLGL